MKDARPEYHYQVGVTPNGVEFPRCAADIECHRLIQQVLSLFSPFKMFTFFFLLPSLLFAFFLYSTLIHVLFVLFKTIILSIDIIEGEGGSSFSLVYVISFHIS